MTNPLTPDQIIANSFNALKKSARSDGDVLNWFKEHAFCLPDVPELLVPYLQLSVNGNKTHSIRCLDYDRIMRVLTLEYSAQLPASQLRGINAQASADMLGLQGTVANKIKPSFEVSNQWALSLNTLEWPYAAALAGLEVLTSLGTNNPHYEEKVIEMWNTAFPAKPWSFALSLYNADLVSDDVITFTNWACDASVAPDVAPHLPDDYLP